MPAGLAAYLVGIFIALAVMAGLVFTLRYMTTPRKPRDEEQGRPAGRSGREPDSDALPGYSTALETLPPQNRPPSAESTLPSAAPPAYHRRSPREAEYFGTARPLTDLPMLPPRTLPEVSPPQSPIFIVGRDSTESVGSDLGPPQSPLCIMGRHSNHLDRLVVPPTQPFPKAPYPIVRRDSTDSIWGDMTPPQSSSHSPAIIVRRDSAGSIWSNGLVSSVIPPPQSPPSNLSNDAKEAVQSEKFRSQTPQLGLSVVSPLSFSQRSLPSTPKRRQPPPPLQISFSNFGREPLTKLRLGTVQVRQPVVSVRKSLTSDAETGNMVANMVKSMEQGRGSRISSEAERCDASEEDPSTLMSTVLNRISLARQQWSMIDARG